MSLGIGIGLSPVFGSAPAAALTLQDGAVSFDGTNDYLTRGADFTDNADTNKAIWAWAFKMEGGDGVTQHFYSNNSGRVRLQRLNNNKIRIILSNNAGVDLAIISSATSFIADDTFHVALLAMNTSDATSTNNWVRLYVDDVLEAEDTDIAQADLDNAPGPTGDHFVGAANLGNEKINGCLGPFFLHFGATLDISVEANRRKFWNTDGSQADWGADGSTPLGVQPLLYLDRKGLAVSDYIANKGSGGGMTENGALAVC